jgi:hypothetical protein
MPKNKFPRSASSIAIGKAVRNLRKMSVPDRIQLLVKAKLMTQAEADKAIARLQEQH